ncbi:hypothetical protein E4U56_000027 [Claviceps arundinis]|uniref:Reverse transcriptase Ty1/copia-type domain-containing protein n=1 Tax=Claviceps arundinis TaxID=1623583 RepID=A0A9P7N091_9HYPO|nr:hypothetical protein E4U56_000027 [Claviceps arundinis]
MIVAAPIPELVESVISDLQRRYELKRLGEPKLFLGIEFVRDRANRSILLHQSLYIKNIMQKFGITDVNPSSVPWLPKADIPAD